nr:hypothetical protein [Tombusviridae sp.]
MNYTYILRPSPFYTIVTLITIILTIFVLRPSVPSTWPLAPVINYFLRPTLGHYAIGTLLFTAITVTTLLQRLSSEPGLLHREWYVLVLHCVPLFYPRALLLNVLYFRLQPFSRRTDIFNVILGCLSLFSPSRAIVLITLCFEIWQYLISKEVHYKKTSRVTHTTLDVEEFLSARRDLIKTIAKTHPETSLNTVTNIIDGLIPTVDLANFVANTIPVLLERLHDIKLQFDPEELVDESSNVNRKHPFIRGISTEELMMMRDFVQSKRCENSSWKKLPASTKREVWYYEEETGIERYKKNYDGTFEQKTCTDSTAFLYNEGKLEQLAASHLRPHIITLYEFLGLSIKDLFKIKTVKTTKKKKDKEEQIQVTEVYVLRLHEMKEWMHFDETPAGIAIRNFLLKTYDMYFTNASGYYRNIKLIPELYKFLRFKCMLQVYRKTGVQPDEVRATAMAWPKALDYEPERVDATVDAVIQELVEECEVRSYQADVDYFPCSNYIALEDRVHYLSQNALKALFKLRLLRFAHILVTLGFAFWIFASLVQMLTSPIILENVRSDSVMTRILLKTANLTATLLSRLGTSSLNGLEKQLDKLSTLDVNMFYQLKSQTRAIYNHTLAPLLHASAEFLSTQNLESMWTETKNTTKTYGSAFLNGTLYAKNRTAQFLNTNIRRLNSITHNLKDTLSTQDLHSYASDTLHTITAFLKNLRSCGLPTLRRALILYYLGHWFLPIMTLTIGCYTLIMLHSESRSYLECGIVVLALLTSCVRLSSSYKSYQLVNQIEAFKPVLTPLLQLQDLGTYKLSPWYSILSSPSSIYHTINEVQSYIKGSTTLSTYALWIIHVMSLLTSSITWWVASYLSTRSFSRAISMNKWSTCTKILSLITLIAVLSHETGYVRLVTAIRHWAILILILCWLILCFIYAALNGTDSSKATTMLLVLIVPTLIHLWNSSVLLRAYSAMKLNLNAERVFLTADSLALTMAAKLVGKIQNLF